MCGRLTLNLNYSTILECRACFLHQSQTRKTNNNFDCEAGAKSVKCYCTGQRFLPDLEFFDSDIIGVLISSNCSQIRFLLKRHKRNVTTVCSGGFNNRSVTLSCDGQKLYSQAIR